MTFARNLIRDLVERRLWPLALLLVVAIVAIPLAFAGGDGASTGDDALALAPAATPADKLAVELLTTVSEALGVAVAWLVNLLNPELVVVGGGIAGVGEPLLGPLRAVAADHALRQSSAEVEIVASTLGDDAEVRGAVLLALRYAERYFRVIFQG